MIQNNLDALTEFLRHATAHLKMKRPDDDNMTVLDYVSPSVNSVYLPDSGAATNERTYRAPSITIVPDPWQEKDGEGELPVTLILAVWDPGTREGDDLDSLTTLNGDGWRAIAVLIDTITEALRRAQHVGPMTMRDGMQCGMYDNNNTDYRPYYVGWVRVTFEYGYQLQADVANELLN